MGWTFSFIFIFCSRYMCITHHHWTCHFPDAIILAGILCMFTSWPCLFVQLQENPASTVHYALCIIRFAISERNQCNHFPPESSFPGLELQHTCSCKILERDLHSTGDILLMIFCWWYFADVFFSFSFVYLFLLPITTLFFFLLPPFIGKVLWMCPAPLSLSKTQKHTHTHHLSCQPICHNCTKIKT